MARAEAEAAYFRAQALGMPLNLAIDLNPGIDHLVPEARMNYWAKVPNNFRSYIRQRCTARGRPLSWWPCVYLGARESTRGTDTGEHLHLLVHVPDDVEAKHLIELMKRQRGDPNLKNWCGNALARKVDNLEHWKGGKYHSAISYLLKAAHPQTYWYYSTVLYKPSGFVTGRRIMISTNLTNAKVVEQTEATVRMLMRLRDERRIIIKRRRFVAARAQRAAADGEGLGVPGGAS